MFWKKHKGKIIFSIIAAALLAAAFWYGGGAPGMQGWNIEKPTAAALADASAGGGGNEALQPENAVASDSENDDGAEPASGTAAGSDAAEAGNDPGAEADGSEPEGSDEGGEAGESDPVSIAEGAETGEPAETCGAEPGSGIEDRPGGTTGGLSAEEKVALAIEMAGGVSSPGVEQGSAEYSEQQGMEINPATGKDRYLTDPVPEGKPIPVEPQDVEIGTAAYSCTLSISCSTIIDNIAWLDPEKIELVPEDGWILPATSVTFYEGESVFNVLFRTCKQMGIHMEFENTPMYNSAYVEGINNLYEFDCGELSGWMYKVNEWFPNYGSSRYQLKDGDVICWVYTCNLGFDVGGGYATGM